MGVYLQPSPRPLLTGLSFSVGSVAIETKIDVCSQLSRFVCIFRGAKLAHAGKGRGSDPISVYWVHPKKVVGHAALRSDLRSQKS